MTLKELNARLDKTIKVFTGCKEKVLGKFLVDMIRGILKAQSIQLASIARGLVSDYSTTARHLFKRLDRNLGLHDLSFVKDKVQKKQIALIDENTLIYFDPTDVVKPFGKKFEALCHVADGSDDHQIKKGYPVLSCVALKNNELIPLEWDLFSYKEEAFESENQTFLNPIDLMAHRSHRKGTFVLDRGFDRFSIIRHLHENATSFIIRLKDLRHFKIPGKQGQTYTRQEIMNYATVKTKAYLDLRIKKKLQKKLFRIEALPVELTSKIDSPNLLYLIRAKASETLTLYLLTNLKNIGPESLSQIVSDYLSRWKVEEFIRFVKQQYKAEKFLVRDLGRIKNLFHLLFISLVILTRTAELPLKFSRTRTLLIKEAKRVFKIPQKMRFFLYTMAEGLSQILKKLTKSLIRLWTGPPNNQLNLNLGGYL